MATLKLCLLLLAAATIAHAHNVIGAAPWAQGTVYYRYDSSVGEELQTKLRQAMETWETATCVRFKMSDDHDCIQFYDYPNEEHSTVGPNEVILGYSCQSAGDLLYTIGKVIGLSTEQSRPDRDEYVSILTENIAEGQEHKFAINSDRSVGYLGEGYDYTSIMHLSASAYSESGEITTKVKNTEEYTAQGSPELGERLELSDGDILRANRLYSCPRPGMCENLKVNVGHVQDLADNETDYLVEVVAIDGEGASFHQCGENMTFPMNSKKWQFFRIAVRENTPQGKLLSTVQTVPIEVGKSSLYHRVGTLQVNLSYECVADGDDCSPNPCPITTACIDELFDYTCVCMTGYGGKNCETQCPLGFDGRSCETDISGDSCEPDPCHVSHSMGCIDGTHDYSCTCFTGFGGKNCERSCPYGFGGIDCDVDVSGDSCSPHPCNTTNTIDCVDGFFNYTCNCETGYGGNNCDVDVSGDSCLSNPCNRANTINCVDGFFNYTCNCETGYGGHDCDIDVSGDSCLSNPCDATNTIDCVDGFFDYTCNCETGYGGNNCDVDVSGDSCLSNPCNRLNTIDCVDGFFNYTCNCETGYGGHDCDIDVSGDSCLSNPCNATNTIDCVDGFFDYTCNCETGYGGNNCDVDVSGDSCLSNPCNRLNTIDCVDGFFNYTCNCETGYGGHDCDIDVSGDSCLSNPCNATNTIDCVDGFFDYTCNCKTGYGGKTCATDVCAHRRCSSNRGSCIPSSVFPIYRCLCPLAWTPESQCTSWESRCLQVVIKYAWGLDDEDGIAAGDSDPYTKITAFDMDGYSTSDQTPHRHGDESPTWNYYFNAGCGRQWKRFYFEVWDADFRFDDRLSSGQSIYLTSLSSLPSCRHTVSLVGGGGSITFDIYYYQDGGEGGPGSCS